MPLVETLGIGFALAFLLGMIASRLKLPPIVGYLLAGIAIGPFTPGPEADVEIAAQLAEVGIILLMFGVGLHFSIRDLLAVKKVAIPGAIGQIVAATALGAAIAVTWGWSIPAGITFGLALSVASTVVLLRLLDEFGILTSMNGRIAVGWLVVEDLVMVLVIILLPVLAASAGAGEAQAMSGGEVLRSLGVTIAKVCAFAAIMLGVGTRVLPWLLRVVAHTNSRELFTLSVLAVTVGIAYASAELFDVSLALGAFFAGVVISESDLSHRAAAETLPLQDAFAVLFFVSVGMLFDPGILIERPVELAAVIAVILLGKSLAAALIVLALNYPLRTALIVSVSLAQIGEFSFILAGLGVSLGVLPEDGRDLILAAALGSISLNTLLFKLVLLGQGWLDRHPEIAARFERANSSLRDVADTERERLRDHAIIVGYGRVGERIVSALREKDKALIVVDHDRPRVERMRSEGLAAIYGQAGATDVLKAAGVAKARVLVVTSPDALQTRQVVDVARRMNPGIETIVGTHSDRELEWLERHDVSFAVIGETAMAASMARHAMESMDVASGEAARVEREVRETGTAGPKSVDAETEEGTSPAPELR